MRLSIYSLVAAVSGATGQLGRLVFTVLSQLLDGGFPAARLVALVRTVSKAKELSDKGVSVREIDYSRSATLAPSLSGVSTLLLISSSEAEQRAAQHQAVLTAAKAAGVIRVVSTSLLRADSSPAELGGQASRHGSGGSIVRPRLHDPAQRMVQPRTTPVHPRGHQRRRILRQREGRKDLIGCAGRLCCGGRCRTQCRRRSEGWSRLRL